MWFKAEMMLMSEYKLLGTVRRTAAGSDETFHTRWNFQKVLTENHGTSIVGSKAGAYSTALSQTSHTSGPRDACSSNDTARHKEGPLLVQ